MKKKKIILLSLLSLLTISSCNKVDNPLNHKDAINNILKKGIGVSRYNSTSQECGDKINSLNCGWYYNWGITDPNQYKINAEYVPMIWGKHSVNENNIDIIKNGYQNGTYKHLLTFNEPDNNSQSNMTVDEAIALWPQLESIGIPLSSPCPADYSSGWLDEFMNKAKQKNYRVDFIAVHCYQDFSKSGIEKKMKTDVLDVIYEKYKLPIWLTEYGAIDISTWAGGGRYNPSCNETNAKKYIKNATNLLESLGYVERYAWFVDNFNETGENRPSEAPYTSLFKDNNSISSTGEIYQSIKSNVPLYIDTNSLPNGKINENYSFQLSASGGTGNYSFSCNDLPNGLTISKGGLLQGKITYNVDQTIKVICVDGNNQTTYKKLIIKFN